MDAQRMLTIRDVAFLLAVSIRTVNRLVQQGKLAAPVHLGARCVRWRAEDVRKLMKS
jgi:excisionase family DNA binding protein